MLLLLYDQMLTAIHQNLAESFPICVEVIIRAEGQNQKWDIQQAHMDVIHQVSTDFWPIHVCPMHIE